MTTILKAVSLTNYRSCKKTDFEIEKSLSTLIGVNGSGKSNLLNGILLLRKIVGATRSFPDNNYNQSSSKIRATFSVDDKEVIVDIHVSYTTSDRNIDNVSSSIVKWNFKHINGKNSWVKIPITKIGELRNLFTYYTKENLPDFVYKQILSTIGISITKTSSWLLQKNALVELLPIMQKIGGYMSNISYYSASQFTDPSRCPTYLEIENNRVSSRVSTSGNRHVKFMYDLYNTSENNPQLFQEFLSIVTKEGIGLVEAIEYEKIKVPSEVIQVATGGNVIRKETDKILVIPRFTIKSFKLSPNQLSEGTFKTLAIIFYLITDTNKLFILEEPEVCIHQGLLSSVLELIKSLSEKRQFIISTHSDFVLDMMEPENVYIVRNDIKKGTTVKRVSSSMSAKEYRALKEYLLSSGNLGEFWRHGELG